MKFDASNLPSKTIPYAVKEFFVEPFRPKQLLKVSESIYKDDAAPLIAAVQEVCNIDVMSLTIGDFYYILAWIRFASRSIPINATWICTGSLFEYEQQRYTLEQITQMSINYGQAEGTEAQEHMLDVDNTDFNIIPCEAHNDLPIAFEDFGVLELSGTITDPRLDYARVKHLAEFISLRNEPQYTALIGAIQYIKEGDTLLDKIRLVQDDMDLLDAASRAYQECEHGVLQTLYKNCPVCGTPQAVYLVIDAKSFFV